MWLSTTITSATEITTQVEKVRLAVECIKDQWEKIDHGFSQKWVLLPQDENTNIIRFEYELEWLGIEILRIISFGSFINTGPIEIEQIDEANLGELDGIWNINYYGFSYKTGQRDSEPKTAKKLVNLYLDSILDECKDMYISQK